MRLLFSFPGSKQRPRAGFHVAQKRLLPGVFRMLLEKWLDQKILAARVSGVSYQTHLRRHGAIRCLSLYRTIRVVGIIAPFFCPTWRCIDVPTQSALIGLRLF